MRELPGTSVMAAAMPPPVQLSAVTTTCRLCGDDAETLGCQRYALVEIRHDPQPKSQPRMLTTTQA